MTDKLQVRNEFKVHLLNKEGIKKATELAEQFTAFLDFLEDTCGSEGREMSIVRTKLEEACFFAKHAMASQRQNQQ